MVTQQHTRTRHLATELRQLLGARALVDEEALARYASDFGRLVDRRPAAVALCESAEEVAEVIAVARSGGWPVTPRGQAHSQSGQSTSDGGIVLDTAGLGWIGEIDERAMTVSCGGGALWRDVVDATLERGLIPPVLTNHLGVSVGGTLSVAGLGVTSFRYGTQADNVEELEVVTGRGELVTCSRSENRELFDAVRCGLGQFGVITSATLRLRPAGQQVRMHYLLYDDLRVLMSDTAMLTDPAGSPLHSIEARSSPCPQSMKRIGEGTRLGEGVQLFSYWMYPLFLTVEHDEGEEPDDAELLGELSFYRHLRTETWTQREFCYRLTPFVELWERVGNWGMAHPWTEAFLPWEGAADFIELVQENLPPQALGPAGSVLMWPTHTEACEAPLFVRPSGDKVMGWGVLPAIPGPFLAEVLPRLDMLSGLAIASGGKRYLSGYVSFESAERWAEHFGERWPDVLAAKERFDPQRIMSPGFVRYD
jgi:cytokinin dehydrogenase